MASRSEPLVQMRGITKRYGATAVLTQVDLDVFAGEVQILAGENGAGKSTLVKILAGVVEPSEGIIERHAEVAVIYQELSLIGSLSVADNLLLGRFPARFGIIDQRRKEEEAKRLLRLVHLDIDCSQLVESFPIGVQQRIEIAKAIGRESRILVMDEPTSALNSNEVEQLFHLMHSLTAQGCGIVYITHKLEEIERIADRITVLRDGLLIGSKPAAELPLGEMIEWMVGRRIEQQFPQRAATPGSERLRLENFTVERTLAPISLAIRAGEIVGLAGLQGSGTSVLAHALFEGFGAGSVFLDGQLCRWTSPGEAIGNGVALLTNDRKASGLVLSMSVLENCLLASNKRDVRAAESTTKSLRLKAASMMMDAGELSGGNQQKVVLAKWMLTAPRVLILDEPTRGIDVGAKAEIYQLMEEWTKQGLAILLISTELPELIALSDRIHVLHRGRATAMFERDDATPERILAAAMGEAA